MAEPIPVLTLWATDEGPPLGSAAVVAYARVYEDGRLAEAYHLHRMRHAEEVVRIAEAADGPVVLLCSDYIWSVEANQAVATRVLAAAPGSVVIHGGPSAPRQAEGCRAFLEQRGPRHIVVAGEGELTFAALLAAFVEPDGFATRELDIGRLRGVEGTSFIDPATGDVYVNPDRPRHAELGDFPSPLLSGELDLVPDDVQRRGHLSIETNRGCPYGCTFCDWGQATMSRVRFFPLDRVFGEIEWLADRQVGFWLIADANWGLHPRDIEVAQAIGDAHRRTGFPQFLGAGPPKNSPHRYVAMIDELLQAGVSLKVAIALQSRDPATLEAVHRTNIKTETYDEITAELRARSLPLHCELMLGLPGSTLESLKSDLQWCLDQQARPHMYRTFVLPNAPMGDPAYQAEHGIVVDGRLIVSTSSYSAEDWTLMHRFAYAFQAFEVLGLLRYVLRYLQWDHGWRGVDVLHELLRRVDDDPERWPRAAFVLHHFEDFIVPPGGWRPLFDELRRLVDEITGIHDAGLETAFEVCYQLVPWPDRVTPFTVALVHDYVRYFEDAKRSLLRGDPDPRPSIRLDDLGPGLLTVHDDPDAVARDMLGRHRSPTDPYFPGFVTSFWEVAHLERVSPLKVYDPMSSRFYQSVCEHLGAPEDGGGAPVDGDAPALVALGPTRRASTG